MLRVGVVVVAYHSADTLEHCLRSVLEQSVPDVEIVVSVIDNSADASTASLCAQIEVPCQLPATNLGFAAACNLAVASLNVDWILLLNPDAWLNVGFWADAVDVLESTPAQIVVPGLVDGQGQSVERLQLRPEPTAEIIYALFGGLVHKLWTHRMNSQHPRYASGAALFIRSEAWNQLNGFDEQFFLFAEDADLFERARDAGMSVDIEEKLGVTHLGSRGTASKTRFAMMCLISGKVSFISKHFSKTSARLVAGSYRVGAISRRIVSKPFRRSNTSEGWALVARVPTRLVAGFRWMPQGQQAAPTVLMWPGASADSVNPYIGEYQAALQKAGVKVIEVASPQGLVRRADVVHIHWPDSLLNIKSKPVAIVKSLGFLLAVGIHRALGVSITWTMHNLQPHEGTHTRFDSMYMRLWISLVDGVIAHTSASIEEASLQYPRLASIPARVCLIPAYQVPEVRTVTARKTSEFSTKPAADVVLSFGTIRPYKCIEGLLYSAANLTDPSIQFRVVGPVVDAEYLKDLAALEQELGLMDVLRPGRLTDIELAEEVRSAALVVLPHEQSLNSSSTILALSLGTPVLVPQTPFSKELQSVVGADRLHLFTGTLNESFLVRVLAEASHALSPVALPDWTDLAASSLSLWSELRNISGGPAMSEISR